MTQIPVTVTQMSDARRLISLGVVQALLDNDNESVSGHMKDVMERCVQENLLQFENWTKTLLQDLLACKTAADDIRALNDHMADYLTQSFRQRNASLSSGAFKQGKPTEPHIKVLKKMNYDLTRYLKLQGITLLDRLYEVDMMSESDRKSIIAKPTDRRKNEAFIEFLCSNFTTEKFKASILPILFQDDVHIDLAGRIADKLEATSTAESIRCTFCTTQERVNIRKLAEGLFEQGSISLSVKHNLCLSENPNSSKWELLLINVQEEKKLLDVLEKSYEHLFREFQETGHPVLWCCCSNMKLGVAEMTDFTPSDIDTSSDWTSMLCNSENDFGPLELDNNIEDDGASQQSTETNTQPIVRRHKNAHDLLHFLNQLASISDISEYIVKQQKMLVDLEDDNLTTRTIESMGYLSGLIKAREHIIHETQKFKDAATDIEKQLAELEAGCDAENLFLKKEAGVIWTKNTESLKMLEEDYLHKCGMEFDRPCVIQ